MKKLIAISVMCALACGAAFAETTVGGQVFVGGSLLQGTNVNNGDESHIKTGAIENDRWNTALKVTFTEGSAGGRIRILGDNAGKSDIFDEWFGWWRPIPQLKLQVGVNKDGDWGTAQISGWGFTGENKNNGGNQGAMGEYNGYQEGRNHARTKGWYPGIDMPSFNISVYPIEDLTVNLALPWQDTQNAAFTFARFQAQVQYRFTDIGTASLSFKGDTGYIAYDEVEDKDSWWGKEQTGTPKIYASFFLTAIENMAVDVGLAYQFPLDNERTETVTNYPFEIGIGYRVAIGDFGFKFRSSVTAGGSTVPKVGDSVKGETEISANILPSYKIGNLTVFFYAGLGIRVNDFEAGDESQNDINESGSIVAWFVNPYVFIPAGNLRFKVGFQVYSDGNKFMAGDGSGKRDPAKISWGIPFGFYAYF